MNCEFCNTPILESMDQCSVCGRPREGGAPLPELPATTPQERMAVFRLAIRSSAQAENKEHQRHRKAIIGLVLFLMLSGSLAVLGIIRYSHRESLMNTAMMSVNALDYEGARQYFAQVGTAEAHLLIGATDYAEVASRPERKEKNLEHMRAEMETALRWRRSYPQAEFYLGLYHYEKGDLKQATPRFERCLAGLGSAPKSPQEKVYSDAATALLEAIRTGHRPSITTQIGSSLLRGGTAPKDAVMIPMTR